MITRRKYLHHCMTGIAGLVLASDLPFAMAAAPKRVIFAINGTLGDKSFFDLGASGMKAISAKYGNTVETKILEMGSDRTSWETTLQDISDQHWDLIVACTYEMSEIIGDVAADHPDKKYVLFDGLVSYVKGAGKNVDSIIYKQNEVSYLAGMLAAGLIRDGVLPAKNGTAMGFLGGMDIPIINDYLVGYIEGARAINKNIKIATSYAGTFSDAAKGKELALSQFRAGSAIGLHVAGQTGLGLLSAAKDTGKFAIGANSDQESIFQASDPAIASRIVTSLLKRVDQTLLSAYELYGAGKLPVGTVQAQGLAENAVGLVESGNMARMASPALKKQIDDAKKAIIAGQLKVPTAFGMSTAALNNLRASVRA
ncbi:MAG TPA: BMP family ABC transporter substrate-binding protein [Herbaspirillum sp.]|nr:BMP family ABC transporter substrate-binding protein [Herbaspirillum sp.]